MRLRAAAGAVGAAVLVGSVLMLRGQVPPPAAAPPSPVSTTSVPSPDPGLPVQEPLRPPRWRVHPPVHNAIDGLASGGHVLYTRTTSGGALELRLHDRDTQQLLLQHPIAPDDAPWASLLHDGLLLVARGRQQVQLNAVDPATGLTTQLAPPPGYGFRPRLAELGDEALVLGWETASGRSCVLAVRPRAGTSRVAWCAEQGRAPGWMYSGVDEVAWPTTAGPPGCPQWQRLGLGGEPEPLPSTGVLCGASAVTTLGGWQIAQHAEQDVLRPLIVASDGLRVVRLGTAAAFVACGRHVYWLAANQAADPDTVYRWLPGASHREVAYQLEASSRVALSPPRCTGGVLSVAVTGARGPSPRLLELRSLGRP